MSVTAMKGNLKNIIWALGERAVQILLSMVVTGLIARHFGVELFGAYQLAMSILFVITAMTWLCPAEIFYSRLKENGSLDISVINTSIAYRLAISITIYIGLLTYVLFSISGANQAYFIMILSLGIIYSEPMGIFRFQLECRGYYYITSRIRLCSLVIKCAMVALLVFMDASPIPILLALILESILVSFGCYAFYKKIDKGYSFKLNTIDKSLMYEIFNDGVKFWFGLICMNAFLKFDRIYMESKLSSSDFGHYAAAFSAFEQFTALATMLLAVLGPILVYRAASDKILKNSMLMLFLFTALGIMGAAVLYMISPLLISILYGDEYIESVPIFVQLVIFSPLVFMDVALSSIIIKNKAAVFFSAKWSCVLLASFLINVIGYTQLGWQAGLLGYIVGWVVAFIFSLTYIIIFQKRKNLEAAI
ncbi:oligosaccharide flippase family protein [Aeromonas bivalvium]|uniref:oligosaccharide flippase family protein n=1 Tax=Aeromonas bivalvium TaxID=440079 RepID=UPI003D1E6A15